jgi:anaerobic magnesium-protoporphyrin IX monomethyl ester cyclase
MTDCLIIGHNDGNFDEYVGMVRAMGEESGAWRDLRLAIAEIDGRPVHALGAMTRFAGPTAWGTPYHNTDFLWPTITYLGTYLDRHGFTFDYVNRFQLEKEALKRKLLCDRIRTVAITTTLHVSVHPILEIIGFIREHNDEAKIVVGGPFISNLPASTDAAGMRQLFEYMDADFYVVQSEGEQALVRILEALKREQSDFSTIPNIAYRSGDGYQLTGAEPEINPLEENMVDYRLFPRQAIGEFVTLRTAKSCPFSCSFCGFPQRAGKYKYLPVDLVERELDAIREVSGVTTLTFIDDTFNVPKKRFQDILRLLIRKQYGFKWNSFFRSDHSDEETIALMGEAGCEGVFLGIESGSDQMLLVMNKTSRRANYLKAIPLLRQAGVSTHANFIVGFPTETSETVRESVSLIEEAQPDFFRAQLWYCDPVTPIWQKREQFGVRGSAFNWSHDTMTAAAACDIVDEMFRTVRGSVWLPQNGFEMWSLFYLQRLGMTLAQVKDFLRAFNALVAEGLSGSQPSPLMVEELSKRARARAQSGVAASPIPAASADEWEMLRD